MFGSPVLATTREIVYLKIVQPPSVKILKLGSACELAFAARGIFRPRGKAHPRSDSKSAADGGRLTTMTKMSHNLGWIDLSLRLDLSVARMQTLCVRSLLNREQQQRNFIILWFVSYLSKDSRTIRLFPVNLSHCFFVLSLLLFTTYQYDGYYLRNQCADHQLWYGSELLKFYRSPCKWISISSMRAHRPVVNQNF